MSAAEGADGTADIKSLASAKSWLTGAEAGIIRRAGTLGIGVAVAVEDCLSLIGVDTLLL